MMHKFMNVSICCIVAIFLLTGNAVAAKKVMLVVGLSSIEADKLTVNRTMIRDAIKNVLSETQAELKIHYVDFLPEDDKATKIDKGREAVEVIKQYQPDVIVTEFDDALQYVGIKFDDIPVVFTQIYDEPENLGLPKSNVTGITRRSFAPDMWTLSKKLMGVKSVAVICKFASSFIGRRNVMRQNSAAMEKVSGVKFTDLYMVDTLDEWKKLVLNWKEDLMHLGDTGRITDGERIVDYTELTKWTVENAKVPVIAANEIDVEAGAILSIVNSEEYISYLTSSMVSELLKGADVSSITHAANG